MNRKALQVFLFAALTFAIVGALSFHRAFGQENAGGAAATPNVQSSPPDIRPDSLSRMPRPHVDDMMTDEDKESFKRVLSWEKSLNDTSGELGPTGTRAWIPQLAEEYRKLGNMVHKANNLDPKYIELISLVAIREANIPAEWGGHAVNGRKLLGAKTVAIIQNEDDPGVLDDKKAALIIRFGRELFHETKVSSSTFAEMNESFGWRGTLDITLLMGYYDQNGILYRAFDQHRAPNEKEGQYPPW
jgi:hypothetical protein